VRDAHSNDEAFWILELSAVWFARVGMKEKPTSPHARLRYVHLHRSSLVKAKRVEQARCHL
jgi:hypothetical protein